ncbi:MAG: DUF1963 domain-containing protein [Verrucomicrobia bacterium]|nr:DUF1963 domain-containing protein [Verrucomicrobiota bacterium]MCH8527877.1 DUF1963 domain-containing protein [Kiritimatiellia bacterium]
MKLADKLMTLFKRSSVSGAGGNGQAFMDELLRKLEPHRLPVCKIKPVKQQPQYVWSGKFGGKAFLPKGFEVPKSGTGSPLRLLAQIHFEEIPKLPGCPENGLLQFFVAGDNVYGADFERPLNEILQNPEGYRVLFHPQVRKDPKEWEEVAYEETEDNGFPITGEYALEFEAGTELPSPTDYRFHSAAGQDEEISDDVYEALFDLLDSSGSKLGGYANFTQDDPRDYQTDEEWLLLLQIDSSWSDGIEIMWGDGGVANFFIEPTALLKNDFSRVWYNWDCC